MEEPSEGAAPVEVQGDKPSDVKETQEEGDIQKKDVDETVPGESDTTETDRVETAEESKEEQDEMEQSTEVEVDAAVIEKLTHSVLEMFLPNLQKAKSSLNGVLHNQEVLIETIQQENSKFKDVPSLTELIQTLQDAKVYHTKLVNLKREMNALMDKSTKLKRRAVKLQQQKQKEELTKADQHERELERERMLTAKVAKNPQKSDKT